MLKPDKQRFKHIQRRTSRSDVPTLWVIINDIRQKLMGQYRKTPRADHLDYNDGDYFITICTKDHKHYFGEIADGKMQLSDIGRFANEQLARATEFNADVEVPLFVVMSNHIHAIVRVHDSTEQSYIPATGQRCPLPSLRKSSAVQRQVPIISRYISSFKGAVTKYARSINIDFHWQNRYHDHLIRDARDGNNIAQYISTNVIRWDSDCFNKTQR